MLVHVHLHLHVNDPLPPPAFHLPLTDHGSGFIRCHCCVQDFAVRLGQPARSDGRYPCHLQAMTEKGLFLFGMLIGALLYSCSKILLGLLRILTVGLCP